MKKYLVGLLVLAALAAGLIFAFKETSAEREREAQGEKPVMARSQVRHGAEGVPVITLDAATQERIGLKTAKPAPGTVPREIKAYGRVLDPAPLSDLVAEIAAAQSALEASSREARRLQTLAQTQNASARTLEAAEAAMKRDHIAHEAAQLKLMTAWGKDLARQPDLPALVRSLVAADAALVRLDLPAGDSAAPPEGARLFTLATPEQPLSAEFLGPAPAVDPQAQGQGFLFLVRTGADGLRPGQALIGFIQQPGEPLHGVLVPPGAIIRAAGRTWVYVQTADTTFTRREIALTHPADGGWLMTRGLGPGDRIVVEGAQMLFSEELKGRLQVGD